MSFLAYVRKSQGIPIFQVHVCIRFILRVLAFSHWNAECQKPLDCTAKREQVLERSITIMEPLKVSQRVPLNSAAIMHFAITTIIYASAGTKPTESRRATGEGGFKRMLEYTMQHLITISLPYMALFTLSLIWASFIYDPTMRVLLYSGLPECWKNVLSFWACFAEDVRSLLIVTGMAVPTWQMHVMACDLVNRRLDVILDNELET